MKNLKLTISEAQEILLMSQSSVYSWIDKGKLQAVETPSGKIIQITEFEANQIREMNLKSKRNKALKNFLITDYQGVEYVTMLNKLYLLFWIFSCLNKNFIMNYLI